MITWNSCFLFFMCRLLYAMLRGRERTPLFSGKRYGSECWDTPRASRRSHDRARGRPELPKGRMVYIKQRARAQGGIALLEGWEARSLEGQATAASRKQEPGAEARMSSSQWCRFVNW